MNPMETLFWYLTMIVDYTIQMMPCMAAALILFLLFRRRRMAALVGKHLVSGPVREGGLLVFVLFSAGLAGLTLFPANLWEHVMNYILHPEFRVYGLDLRSFYPPWEVIVAETDYRNLFSPFQEILRGLRGGPWVFFMLLGNIGMFLPLGFFPALLWRRPRWWKSLLVGFAASVTIEFVQFFIGRSTDIDDVILNTAGAVLGYWLFCLARALFPRLTAQFHCRERG